MIFRAEFLWAKDMVLPNGGSPLAADAAGNVYLAAQNGLAWIFA